MYLGTLVLCLATPLALGSYMALPFFALLIPVLILRILDEEEVLRRDLPGYSAYCRETRYRLLPSVWRGKARRKGHGSATDGGLRIG
jgi:protein-S-isoprenylcysteine O-methyltransferase Ste14